MRDALLADLGELIDVEVICCYDQRVPPPLCAHALSLNGQDDVWQVWRDLIHAADAAWIVAPESAGMLQRMTELVAAQLRPLIGCTTATIALTASKLATLQALQSAGVPCIPAWSASEWLQLAAAPQAATAGWVVKPDDGVGCADTVLIGTYSAVSAWLRQGREHTHIVQPYRGGTAASLSLLCRAGRAWLLSCNRQKVRLEHGHFTYHGSTVNGLCADWPVYENLAQQIAQALPELQGYVGVDLIACADPRRQFEVLEINPRLTTSYAGLKAATGVNPAALVLDLFGLRGRSPSSFSLPEITKNTVEITL